MTASIYQFPEIFRAVHMEAKGEIGREVRFLRKIWRRHAHRPVRRVLDIASGDSPHGRILARSGLRVVGIDRSPTMIAAGLRDPGAAAGMQLLRRNIERFTLPGPPFDSAIFMCETFPVMVANRDLLAHLRSVAKVLRRGALYCVDIDRHDPDWPTRARRLWRRRRVNVGDAKVAITEYKVPLSWERGAWIYELRCRIRFADGRIVQTRDLIPIRYTLPSLMELAALASGCFRPIANYSYLVPNSDRPLLRQMVGGASANLT